MRAGEVIAERFEVLEGRGGESAAARLFRARDLEAGGLVALKLLQHGDDLDEERLRREAALVAELSSPFFARFVASGRTASGAPYLATEWLDGEDLAERLAREPLDVEESLALARRVAEAVGLAHARGIVHRDLKPSNVFLPGGDPRAAKVIDFGVARRTRETRRWTDAGTLLGTPGYMAPEQAQGSSDVDARADVFSLGCILFECLAGVPPFGGGHAMGVLSRVLLEDAPRILELRPGLGPGLDDLISRTLARGRDARPADGTELALEIDALGACTGGRPARASSRSLGLVHQRVTSLLLVLAPETASDPSTSAEAADAVERTRERHARRLRRATEPYGAEVTVLADDLFALRIEGASYVGDEACALARSALAVRTAMRGAMLVVSTGRATVAEGHVVGEVMDRGVRLLGRAREDTILVDETTSIFLQGRFRVAPEAPGEAILVGERRGADVLDHHACFGRERELHALDAALGACGAEGGPRAVLVVAPPGGGKSCLRDAWLARVCEREEDVELLLGVAAPDSPAYALAGDIVRRAAGILPGDDPATQAEKLEARLGKVPGDEERKGALLELGALVASVLPRKDQGGTGQWRAPRAKASFEAHFLRWLECECALGPVALIVEEIQWADAASADLLARALDPGSGSPLLVVGLARPELAQSLPDLFRERAVQELRLGPLPSKASQKLLLSVLGERAGEDPASLAGIAGRAEGHPLLLQVLARAEQAMPDAILGFLQSRFSVLGDEARRALRAGAAAGLSFSPAEVEALLPPGSPAEELLLELVREGLLESEAEGRFRFRSGIVRGAAERSLTEADRDLARRVLAELAPREPDSTPDSTPNSTPGSTSGSPASSARPGEA